MPKKILTSVSPRSLIPSRTPRAPSLGPIAAALAALAVLALAGCGEKKEEGVKRAPPEVGVIVVSTQDAPLSLELPGRLSASQVAEIRPQVSGIVQKRLFEEGKQVKAGQALYQLDAATYEAERARSAAALQKAEAQVAVARSRAERDAELLKADALSRQSADDSASALRQAQADVAVARAALDAARVQLDRTCITAPISGRIEVSTVTAGALVTAAQTQALTTVQQLDPMHVDIVQSSAEILQLRRQLDASSGSRQVKLILEDGSEYARPGTLQFSGVTVDRGTGAVTLRAVVPNPDGALLPGMVVRARLLAGVDSGAIVVPQQGVTRSPTGDATALVVGPENKLQLRQLVLTRAVGNQWLVAKGLQAGDKLAIEGLQRVRAGQVVTPVPAGMKKGAGAGGKPAAASAASAVSADGGSPSASSGLPASSASSASTTSGAGR